jgi:hypothetical protein
LDLLGNIANHNPWKYILKALNHTEMAHLKVDSKFEWQRAVLPTIRIVSLAVNVKMDIASLHQQARG